MRCLPVSSAWFLAPFCYPCGVTWTRATSIPLLGWSLAPIQRHVCVRFVSCRFPAFLGLSASCRCRAFVWLLSLSCYIYLVPGNI